MTVQPHALDYAPPRPSPIRRLIDRVPPWVGRGVSWVGRAAFCRPLGPAAAFAVAWACLLALWDARALAPNLEGALWQRLWRWVPVPYLSRESVAKGAVLVAVAGVVWAVWVRRWRWTGVGLGVVLGVRVCLSREWDGEVRWADSAAWASAGVAVAGWLGLVRSRRLAAAAGCLGFAVSTAVASGAVQVVRCPHATYVQVFGGTHAVAGERCGNEQPTTPWWAR